MYENAAQDVECKGHNGIQLNKNALMSRWLDWNYIFMLPYIYTHCNNGIYTLRKLSCRYNGLIALSLLQGMDLFYSRIDGNA